MLHALFPQSLRQGDTIGSHIRSAGYLLCPATSTRSFVTHTRTHSRAHARVRSTPVCGKNMPANHAVMLLVRFVDEYEHKVKPTQ
jgi:hypothetical protein